LNATIREKTGRSEAIEISRPALIFSKNEKRAGSADKSSFDIRTSIRNTVATRPPRAKLIVMPDVVVTALETEAADVAAAAVATAVNINLPLISVLIGLFDP
jgi:hypothetical protein